jgi:hypothetical protein
MRQAGRRGLVGRAVVVPVVHYLHHCILCHSCIAMMYTSYELRVCGADVVIHLSQITSAREGQGMSAHEDQGTLARKSMSGLLRKHQRPPAH